MVRVRVPPGRGWVRWEAMGHARAGHSEVVDPPALPTIRSAAAMYLSISAVNPTPESLQALARLLRLPGNGHNLHRRAR